MALYKSVYYYYYIKEELLLSLSEQIFKIGEYLAKLQAKT